MTGIAGNLNAVIYLFAAVLTGTVLIWISRDETRSTPDLWLKRTLVCFAAGFLAGFIGSLWPLSLPVWIGMTLYSAALIAGMYCWRGYARSQLGMDAGEKSGPLKLIPWLAAMAVPLINPLTRWLFDVGADGAFRWRYMAYALPAVLFVLTLPEGIASFRLAKAEVTPSRITHLTLAAAFPLSLIVAAALVPADGILPFTPMLFSLALTSVYIAGIRHQVSVDALTQVNNRQNLLEFMEYKLKNHTGGLFLLMIDVDDFKSINDTYGHLEGDRALKLVSGALKKACGPFPRRPYIARYGGDEFIVMMEGTEEDVLTLCSSVRSVLKEDEGAADARSRVTISVGYVRWREGMTAKELIREADDKLYRVKPKTLRR